MSLPSLPKLNRGQITTALAAFIVSLIVGGIVWGFAQQLVLAGQMRAEEQWLERSVTAERARHDALNEQLAYVQTDEYVECWARGEAHMTKPGETAIVLIDEANVLTTTASQPTPTPPPENQPLWQELWELIFGP